MSLMIAHTFVGDLRVTLISPSGTEAVLHDRTGGNANDLASTFDSRNTPAMAAFDGEPVDGDWTLLVQDLARMDRGRLKEWKLELSGTAGNAIDLEDNPGVTIPDNAPVGIERALRVSAGGTLEKISLDVDITHTFIGDLLMALTSPAGTNIVLHNRSGGASNNIIRTYSQENTLALTALHGESIAGDWVLRVRDLAGADQGKLNRWALKIEHT